MCSDSPIVAAFYQRHKFLWGNNVNSQAEGQQHVHHPGDSVFHLLQRVYKRWPPMLAEELPIHKDLEA